MTASATAAAPRLHYLDALRSFCMLFGILVHTATLDGAEWLSTGSTTISEHFRMATFFVISGFFALMMLDKRGLRGFARHRALSLVLPLASALVLLNPVTLWLVYQVQTGPVGLGDFLRGDFPAPARPLNWHLHLWFLFTLIAYMALCPGLSPLLRTRPLARLLDWLATRPATVFAGLVAALMITGEIAGRALFALLFEPVVGDTPVSWLFRATLQYAPYFILGAAAWTHRPLFEALHRVSWPLVALGLALSVLRPLAGLGGGLGTAFEIVAEETLTVALAMALFSLSRRWLSAPRASVAALNDAVYSIYLLHYLLIYALAVWVFGDLRPHWLQFIVICLATFALAFTLHRLVIRPVPLLYLLFNGKRRLAPGR